MGRHSHFYTKSPGDLGIHTRQRNTIIENTEHVALLLEENKNRLSVAKVSQEVWLRCFTLSRTPEPGRYLCHQRSLGTADIYTNEGRQEKQLAHPPSVSSFQARPNIVTKNSCLEVTITMHQPRFQIQGFILPQLA